MKNGKENFKNNIGWRFHNTYNTLPKVMLSKLSPAPVKSPKLIVLNNILSQELGLNFSSMDEKELAALFSGNVLPEGSESFSQAYAGHQFGHFTMLGDGRAIIIGEHITKNKNRFDIQFKGSGLTPYSRNGDGRAALGPMLREYIISEAMHGLNIPTTRSLAVVTTGEKVIRETILPGAILTRVASSHIRVGTFQYAAMHKDKNILKSLFDYAIDRHYPNLKNKKNSAVELLKIVMEKQIDLVVNWMRVGFIHGVMNTDNMTISGETIDYDPCAFMDNYDPETVFSSIDYQGRYSYFNQPGITKWNLIRFAETLLSLINAKEDKAIKIANEVINNFGDIYKKKWITMMRSKIGLLGEENEDQKLIEDLLKWMHQNKADYTNTFLKLMSDEKISQNPNYIKWHERWKNRLARNKESFKKSLNLMKINNPLVIPRNHKVDECLESANSSESSNLLKKIIIYLNKPYEDQHGISDFQVPSKVNEKKYKTFCGT